MRTVHSRQYTVDRKVLGLFVFVFSLFTVYCLLTTPVSAQLTEYTLLEPLPIGATGGEEKTTNAGEYIPGIFRLTLAIAGALAVLRLIYAGILYMSSDAYSNTNEAKKIINDALWGLALTLGAWIIVATLFDNEGDNLNLSLNIPRQELPSNENLPGGGGGGGGPSKTPLCQGDCPYSYQRGDATIKYKDCANCVEVISLFLTPKVYEVNGESVKIEKTLGERLKAIQQKGISLTVTESWPPTVNHKSQGHYDGSSADVRINNSTDEKIKEFIDHAKAANLRVVYETNSNIESLRLVSSGIPRCQGGSPNGCVLYLKEISAPHFSTYK